MTFQRTALFALFILSLASCKQQESKATCPDLSGHYPECGEIFDAVTQETTRDDVTTYSFHTHLPNDRIDTLNFVADGNSYPMSGDDQGFTHYSGTCRDKTLTLNMYASDHVDGSEHKSILRITLASQEEGGDLKVTSQFVTEAYDADGELAQKEESDITVIRCVGSDSLQQ